MAKDVVCGMTIEEKKSVGKSTYKGKTFFFCSASCKSQFDKNPGKFVK